MKICDSMKLDVLKLGLCCVVFDLVRTDFYGYLQSNAREFSLQIDRYGI
jgi:hypothetical protein